MKKIFFGIGTILLVSFFLVGCKGTDYKDAVALQESGDYSGALELFESIGNDYKDVAERVSECQKFVDAITAFDTAVEVLEEKNTELDTIVSDSSELVNSEDPALDESLRPSLESAVSDTKAAKVLAPERAISVEEINIQTQDINNVDYTDMLKKINEAYDALDKSIKQYKLVDNPTEEYVIKCLKKVKHAVDISAVTEDNDPNGHLGKQGGYTATVYFTSDWVDQSDVIGNTVIDKGADGGGAVEVYANVEDAESRETYLATFDGGIFASGSHTVVGTCLVRTSDNLPASKQKKLEKAVIKALTDLDNQ